MISALTDIDRVIRLSAVTQIGNRLGGTCDAKSALEPLVRLMQADKENDVRREATWALGCIGDIRTIKYLIPIAQNESEKRIRLMAQSALGWIRSSEATEALIPLLQDEDEQIRLNIIEALTKIRDTRAVNQIGSLVDDESYKVRQSAVSFLKKIGNKEAFIILSNTLLYNPNLVFRTIRDWTGELPDDRTKAKYILQDVLANSSTSFQLRSNLVFPAMLPFYSERTEQQLQVDQENLIKTLIEEALVRKNDPRMISIIADLLCFGAMGKDKAASIIEQYQKDFSVSATDFEMLRKYVGGERAIEPILAQLRVNLDDHFLEPIDSLNKTTFEMWEDTVKQAKRGFDTRLYMTGLWPF